MNGDDPDRILTANALRAEVIAWLLDFGGIDDLDVPSGEDDLGALERSRYERRLVLPAGALSIGRFAGEFTQRSVDQIGEWLLDESYLGAILRTPIAQPDTTERAELSDKPRDPAERFTRFLVEIGLQPAEMLMLSGSGDVAAFFAAQGAETPDLRRHPGTFNVTRFAVAVVCRGPLGHKQFEPWTQQVKNAGKHNGPTLLTATSSNVSGIVEFLYARRISIRRYVHAWRK